MMEWTATNIFLLIFVIGTVLFILYDLIVLAFWKGATKLKVALRSRGRFDGYIFFGLLVLLFALNISRNGSMSTTVLLGILSVLFFYIALFRKPHAIFKAEGFFYTFIFFPYAQIERINLSEDGILVIETGRSRLMLRPRSKADLDKMMKTIAEYK
ncbi:DUF986 family protein [Listeria kieliensis]